MKKHLHLNCFVFFLSFKTPAVFPSVSGSFRFAFGGSLRRAPVPRRGAGSGGAGGGQAGAERSGVGEGGAEKEEEDG